jgi:hypothetical protein
LAQKNGVFFLCAGEKIGAASHETQNTKTEKITMTPDYPIDIIDPTPLKKRKTKDLPSLIASLTEANFRHSLKTRLETDPKESGEVMVAEAAAALAL